MSYTEIYAFDAEGNAKIYGETRNAWRGAMAVWNIMDERHLPPYIPDSVKCLAWYRPEIPYEEIVKCIGFKPGRLNAFFGKGENPVNEIWSLANSLRVPLHERIVLHTTFDRCLVRKKHLHRVIDAFKRFEGETSLKEQADILQKAADDPGIIAVGWNQTSVNADSWYNAGGYDEATEESIPYNCLTGDSHYWLFDELICDENVERWWDELSDVPFDDHDPNHDMVLAEDWRRFKKGTKREDIWRWFDEHHSRGVAYLLNERGSE